MARLLDWAEVWARELGRWVGGIWKSSAAGKASLVAVAAICSLGEVRGFRLTIEAQATKEMYEKELSRLLDGPLRLLVGRDRAREEVQKGRKQVEKKVEEGRKQVEKKVQEGRKQVEKETR